MENTQNRDQTTRIHSSIARQYLQTIRRRKFYAGEPDPLERAQVLNDLITQKVTRTRQRADQNRAAFLAFLCELPESS